MNLFQAELVILVGASLVFTWINGFHGGCNVVATIITSRSIEPRRALLLAALAELAGPLLLGTGVAVTMGNGILLPHALAGQTPHAAVSVLACGVCGGLFWNLVTYWKKLPANASHALIGGLLGSGLASLGPGGIHWQVLLWRVLLVLLTSPVIGFVLGYLIFRLLSHLLRHAHTRHNRLIKGAQIASLTVLGMSHGSNDAQKSMGLIMLGLGLAGNTEMGAVPFWVQLACAVMISSGLLFGGQRLIRKVGSGIFRVRPIHSLSSQIASAGTMLTASLLGGPVSTSHVVNSSIMGVGSAERPGAVKWQYVRHILVSWVMTIPMAAIAGAVILLIYRLISGT